MISYHSISTADSSVGVRQGGGGNLKERKRWGKRIQSQAKDDRQSLGAAVQNET